MLEIIEKDTNGIYKEEDLVVGSFIISDINTSYVIGMNQDGTKKLLLISDISGTDTIIRDSQCKITHILDVLNTRRDYKLYTPNQVKMTLEVG